MLKKGSVIKVGYILDLRKKIGHSPIIMTSACVIVINANNQILLQKRRDNGLWGYPGGSLELKETFEEAAKRELFEETGLEALELNFFEINSGEKMHYIYPNGDEVYIAEVIFLCRKYQGELVAQEDEVIEQKFFDIDKIPSNMFSVNKESIMRLIATIKENNYEKK